MSRRRVFFYGPLLEPRSDPDAELIWRLLGLATDTAVLDLGCGHGRIANRLAGRRARVTGLDASPLFLQRAREGAAGQATTNAEHHQGDMRALPFDPATFEVVIIPLPASPTSGFMTTAVSPSPAAAPAPSWWRQCLAHRISARRCRPVTRSPTQAR